MAGVAGLMARHPPDPSLSAGSAVHYIDPSRNVSELLNMIGIAKCFTDVPRLRAQRSMWNDREGRISVGRSDDDEVYGFPSDAFNVKVPATSSVSKG